MCGITAIFNIHGDMSALRKQALEMSKRIRHRGPDWSGIYQGKSAILAHERLSIVDPASGKQPLISPDGKQILCVNGEMYNHRELRQQLKDKYEFQTGSDCEVILALYREKGPEFLEELNGIFAFALYDEEKDLFLIARDPIGVIPLYFGYDNEGHLLVSSELKGLEGFAVHYEVFKPGCLFYSPENEVRQWYHRDWSSYEAVQSNPADEKELREALEAAVQRQLMSDVPYGVLLSGGLDSSITSAIAKKYAAKRIEDDSRSDAWWPQLHSFAIGLISDIFVSIPPENKMILNANIPMNCAALGLLNWMPKPSLPKSIPTPKNSNKAGSPKRKPALPATILKKKITEATSKTISGLSIKCKSLSINVNQKYGIRLKFDAKLQKKGAKSTSTTNKSTSEFRRYLIILYFCAN